MKNVNKFNKKDRTRKNLILIFTLATVLLSTAMGSMITELAKWNPDPTEVNYSPDITYTYLFEESGLSSEISSWSVTLGSNTKSAAPGSDITWSYAADESFSYSVGSIPGYTASPSSGKTSAGTISISFSGSPQVPSISSVSGSPNPAQPSQTVSLSSSGVNFNDVNGGAYAWSATGGTFSSTTVSNPTWSDSSSGSYTITLKVSNDAGSSSSSFIQYVNTTFSVSSVSSSLNPSDSGQAVTFSVTASGGTGSNTYQWYQNGSTVGSNSSSYAPSLSVGSYSIYVKVTDSVGVSVQSSTLSQTVNPDPTVSISSSQNPTDVSNTVEFTSSVSGGTPGYSYSWSADGNSYTTQDINVSFSNSGSYSISLTVKDAAGESVTQSLTETVNSDPTVTASSNVSSADIGYPIGFSSSPSGGSDGYTYSWTINSNQVSTSGDFSYSFSSSGSYTVTVTVTDGVGQTASASVSITVNPNPTISISSSQNPTDAGNSVTFSSSESGGTGTITYAWYVNGASEGSGVQLSYTFSSSGTYEIKLTVTDVDGHTVSAYLNETVNVDPTISISSSQDPTDVGNTVTFSSTASGGTTSYNYTWYVNSVVVGYSSSYTASFASSGSNTIKVVLKDAVGNTVSASLTETVNSDPSVTISSSQNPTDIGNTVTFTASGSGGTGSYTYQWYLNGAAVSGATSSSYSTSFSSSGTDSLYVVLTDGVSNTAQSSTLSETVNPDPTVSISSSQNPTDIGNTVTFTASGSGGTGSYSYTWYINGASQSSTSSSMSSSFSTSGTYYINITIKDANGNTASYSLQETINVDPSVTISSSQNPTDIGNTVTFSSSGSGGTGSYSYQWYVNSNAISGATSSTYSTSFTSGGTYSVYVILTDGVGNTAESSTISEIVNADPSVTITSGQNPTDVGNSVRFNATGSGGTGSYNFTWLRSGSTVGYGSYYLTSFGSSGSYVIEAILTDGVGNKAYYNFTETVNADPSVSVTSSQNPTDIGNTVTFTASGSGGTGSYSYTWYINGASQSSTGYQLTTSFSSSGTDTIEVILSDTNGNKAYFNFTETVDVDPSVTASSSPNPTDIGVSVTFTASGSGGYLSSGSYNYTWLVDGQNLYGQTVTFSFTSAGTYSVQVTIRDTNGNTASTTISQVVNPLPTVTITEEYPNGVDPNVSATFTANPSYGTTPYNYTWYVNGVLAGYGQILSYKFSNTGTSTLSYTVNVTVRDHLNQTAGISVTQTVYQPPYVAISGPLSGDIGTSQEWLAIVKNGSDNYNFTWYIDGSEQSSHQSYISFTIPSVSDTGNGTFSVKVTSDDLTSGGNASITIWVHIDQLPTVTISGTNSTIDAGQSISFSSSILNGTSPFKYQWYENNGPEGTGSTLTYTFSSSGTYEIKLVVTDVDGETSTSYLNVTVNTDPSVAISQKYNSPDAGISNVFNASGSGGTPGYNYTWYNGSTIIGYGPSLSYSFSSAGYYTIKVVLRDARGLETFALASETVLALPSASITGKNPTDVGQNVSFSSVVSGGSSPYSYSWSIGGVQVGTGSSLTYSFSSSGTYTVDLTVTDSFGKISSTSFTITIHSDPSVTFSVPSQVDQGYTTTISPDVTGGTSGFSYEWYVNGAAITNSENLTIPFGSLGNQTIKLVIIDAAGYSVSYSLTVLVVSDPSVTLTAEHSTIDENVNDSFSASISFGTGTYSYAWYVNGVLESSSSSFSWPFSSTGPQTVKVTVTDSQGFTASSEVSLYVNPLPVVNIVPSKTVVDSGQNISFSSVVSGGSSPYSYSWSINGAVEGTSSSLTFEFSSAGTYTVNLTVTDSFGKTVSIAVIITVNVLPSASVSFHSSLDAGQSDQFYANVSGGTGPYTYAWYIDGTVYSSSSSFNFSFVSSGTYSIQIKIMDSTGDVFSQSGSVLVNPDPTVGITASYGTIDPNIQDNLSVKIFNGTSSYNVVWTIDGNQFSTSQSFSYIFSSSGTYKISVSVTDATGYVVTKSMTITVRSNPSVEIQAPVNKKDANSSVSFRPILSGGVGPYSYQWLIGGKLFNSPEVNLTFLTPGNYSVQLTVSDSFGRDAINSTYIIIYSDPSVLLESHGNPTVSIGYELGLNISGGVGPYRVHWIFPSGEQASGNNITHTFSSSGPDTIQTQVTDITGFTVTQNFTLTVNLYTSITANQTVGLGPLSVEFSSSVLGGSDYSYNWSFGNGQHSLLQDPIYKFPVGNYTVHFSVVSANGATGEKNMSIQSLPAPVSFLFSSGLNVTQSFHFQAVPNWDAAGPYNMSWSFPNGQTLTDMNVTYKFPVYSELNTVIATFSYGSGHLITQYLTVRMVPSNPVPVISGLPSEIVKGKILAVNGSSSYSYDASIISYQWTYNGNSYSGEDQFFEFNSTGYYNITLSVKDSLGATSSVTEMIHVVTPGTNSSIAITVYHTDTGPLVTYSIHVSSTNGISAVEAFLGSESLPLVKVSGNGSVAVYNLTLNQQDYLAGTFEISIVVFNNNSQSNSATVQFTVSSTYGKSQFNLVALFGGLTNFWLVMLSILGTLATVYGVTRSGGDQINIDGTILKGKPGKALKIVKTKKMK